MRKIALSAIVGLVLLASLNAVNMQKTFSRDSSEYQATYALCISSGVLPPSSVTPVTGAELAAALSRIPYELLNNAERAVYDKLLASLEYHPLLEYDIFGMDPNPTIGLDMFAQSAISQSEKDILFPREDRTEVLSLSFDFKFADSGYGFVDWLMLSPMITDYSGKHFDTNLI